MANKQVNYKRSELSHQYDPLMDCLKVTAQRNGFSATCWVNSEKEVEEQRERLEAAINCMEAAQQRLRSNPK